MVGRQWAQACESVLRNSLHDRCRVAEREVKARGAIERRIAPFLKHMRDRRMAEEEQGQRRRRSREEAAAWHEEAALRAGGSGWPESWQLQQLVGAAGVPMSLQARGVSDSYRRRW